MSKELRVVVVGGGIVGLSTAYYCALMGHRVTVLDPEPLGHQGCSWGNGGMVVPSHFEPLAAPGMIEEGLKMMLRPGSPFSFSAKPSASVISWMWRFWEASTRGHVERCSPVLAAMHLASRRCFEELSAELGDGFGFDQNGMYMLCATKAGLREETHLAELAHKLGLSAEVLTPGQLSERQPGLSMQVAGAVHYADDCHLTPGRFLELLAERAIGIGVSIRQAEVQSFRVSGSRIEAAKTTQGDVAGDAFVIAAGTWTAPLAKGLGLDIPIISGKGYSVTLADPPEMPSAGLLLKEGRVAVTPMLDGMRICGTMQISDRNLAVDKAKVAGIRRSASRFLPAFREAHFAGAPVWCGLRPVSADGMPFVGPVRKYGNLQIAAGHGMMGLSLGPITGKLVAQSLTGEPLDIDTTLMDPDRYA